MLEAEYVGLNGLVHQVIQVDPDVGAVTFFKCHWPRKFLAEADAEYRCSMSELKGMSMCGDGDRVVVKTPVGWAYLSTSAVGFDGVYKALREGMPRDIQLAWHEWPGMKPLIFSLIGVPLLIPLALVATVLLNVVFERLNLSLKPIEDPLIIFMLLPFFGVAFVLLRAWRRKRRARRDI